MEDEARDADDEVLRLVEEFRLQGAAEQPLPDLEDIYYSDDDLGESDNDRIEVDSGYQDVDVTDFLSVEFTIDNEGRVITDPADMNTDHIDVAPSSDPQTLEPEFIPPYYDPLKDLFREEFDPKEFLMRTIP